MPPPSLPAVCAQRLKPAATPHGTLPPTHSLKIDSLCIPTAFCSYGGEALDKKTPLLRSMEALSAAGRSYSPPFRRHRRQSVSSPPSARSRNISLSTRSSTMSARTSSYTGRTLFGARAPKGQELEDHYFGAIKPTSCRVHGRSWTKSCGSSAFLPRQSTTRSPRHSTSWRPIFSTTNVATDHNQLTMEIDEERCRSATALSACCMKSRLQA